MSENSPNSTKFIESVQQLLLTNLSNANYGVSELADDLNMSRSNLLRKIKKEANVSASEYIRQFRLKQALPLLEQGEANVSEISYALGFSSTAYFVKCFREFYGYTPGEFNKQPAKKERKQAKNLKRKSTVFIGVSVAIILLLVIVFKPFTTKPNNTKISIAVLPFKNESNDADNVYIVNGIMENILINLQQLDELKVVSRTSVEKYRDSELTVPELAKVLNVDYVVEGSGQKIGDDILLNVQLIEAKHDDHLWADSYERKTQNVFELQAEVSKQIAGAIHVVISPEVEQRIEAVPTENMVAYDYFLQGVNHLNQESKEGLDAGIPLIEKAIAEDPEFGRAYAALAMAYYYKDMFDPTVNFEERVNELADKALLYDPQLPQAFTAKALYFNSQHRYSDAVVYLEKALEYNPNSALVINTLSDLYATRIPNTAKYLEYALMGVELDIAKNDSNTASFIYLHLSNALIQSGFVKESLEAIDKSLAYNSNNLFSEYIRAYIIAAKHKNLAKTKQLLLETYRKDTTRFDVMQELGNVCYYMYDFESSYSYFSKFLAIKEQLKLDVYIHKNIEIAYVYRERGYAEKAESLAKSFYNYAQNDASIYKHMSLCMYHAYREDTEKSLEHLALFAGEEDFQYWILLFMPIDPVLSKVSKDARFKKHMEHMEQGFWARHEKVRRKLESQGLLDVL